MSSIVVALVSLLTALAVVAIGIATAYLSVAGILQAFAYQAPKASRLVLLPTQHHASGDYS